MWKVAQDAVHWVDIGPAQRMGRNFYQTRLNAMILHDTLPPICIERVVFRKITKSCIQEFPKWPRLAHTITLKANWQTNLDQNAEASASSRQSPSTGKLGTLKEQDSA